MSRDLVRLKDGNYVLVVDGRRVAIRRHTFSARDQRELGLPKVMFEPELGDVQTTLKAAVAEARDAVKRPTADSPAASPIMKDSQRAGEARRGEPRRTDDAQLTGIDPDGAKKPAYQAAYRSCMRKSGF